MTIGLDPIHDARRPICHQEAAAPVDEQRQRMLEAGREGDNTARTTVRLQLDADDAPAEAAAVVLAPLGDEESAPVPAREALADGPTEPDCAPAPAVTSARVAAAGSPASELFTHGGSLRHRPDIELTNGKSNTCSKS